MWWGPLTWYKNAVTTELFVDCAVGVYELLGDKSDLESAIRGWIWFKECGMINEKGLVNDGLTLDFKYSPQAVLFPFRIPPFPFFFTSSLFFPVRFVPRSYVHFYIYKSSTKFINKRNNHQTI